MPRPTIAVPKGSPVATQADTITLDAQPRAALGRANGPLRRSGIVPIHVYGRGEPALSLQVSAHDLSRVVAHVRFTTPLTVRANGREDFVLVREVQRHPVTGRLLHVDLLRISRTERMRATVPLHLTGEAPASRLPGASLFQDLHQVMLEALPTEMPSQIIVDIAVLREMNSAVHARDIVLPAGVTLITGPDEPVVRIVQQRVEAEPEAAAAAEAATVAEVPTVKQGKVEAEEEPAEPAKR